jgi:flagellar hook-associated protein 3 FlgL
MISLSTPAFFERATSQIGALRARAEDLQQQIGSGQRLSRSSDDPVAAARLRTLARGERLATIDQHNSDQARTDLRLTDNALGSVANAIIQAQELAMAAASGTQNADQRAAIGRAVESVQQALLIVANGRNGNGFALFGGQSAGAAYEDTGASIDYVGTATVELADLGDGQSIAPSLIGPEVFEVEVGGVTTDLFAILGTLAAELQGVGDGAGAARDALDGLGAALSKVTTAQTVIGARLSWVELMDDRREATGELVAEEQAAIGGADLATTMTRLQEVMTVLEASQASFVRLANLSLFDMLR